MSAALFRLNEHVLPCNHIREYYRATANEQEDVFHLAIKQYTPLDNLQPKNGDITIIGAHANGFPKELYEPLWDELLKRSKKEGFTIRSIWIADVAHQGQSSELNESKLGNDPNWFDHSRDLLHMINHFRAQMPLPLIGLGHSMGGCQLVNLSLMHPRLFTTLILVDPVIQSRVSPKGNFAPAFASARRRDRWPSRSAAKTAFLKSPFYRAWDPRVLDLWIRFGLRELPTALYPTSASALSTKSPAPATAEPTLVPPPEREVTLTTTKHQEVLTFLRSNFTPLDSTPNPLTHPDVPAPANSLTNQNAFDNIPDPGPQTPFYRPENIIVFHNLPHLRPSVLYIFGSESDLSAPEFRAQKMALTGSGIGGSGGAEKGRVKEVVVEGAGHLIPMERVEESAENVAGWVGKEIGRWRDEEKVMREEWEKTEKVNRAKMRPDYEIRLKEEAEKAKARSKL
ncbi:alpha/beta-hydrolase [Aulographum hederae CBS 113979]|uniref:Alpha/beta-hydrolase n=1 Tax=Aulographum hederae CBS 113979 TaxID=1176131 RepID=A0A6G1H8A4_9PEZI|nr:alpha/beta-hydrolase [Aulographum hederae CBS 113979]